MMRRNLTAMASVLAVTQAAWAQTAVTPGHGELVDPSGSHWVITPSGSIMQDDRYTPGGGGTARLAIVGGVVWGQDRDSLRWLTLVGGGQWWAPSPIPPPGVDLTASPVAAPPSVSPAPVMADAPALPVAGAPAPATAAARLVSIGCNVAPNNFSALDGVIWGLDQKPFVPHGINVIYGGANPSAAQILAQFPGTTMVRVAVYHYESAASLKPYVDDLTSHGMVVVLEDHHNNDPNGSNAGGGGGTVFTGGDLATELAWDADLGAAFKSNPRVWHGTNNEPSMSHVNGGPTDPAALSQWQWQEYQAIRNTGNNNLILLEVNSAGPGKTATGYDPSVYAKMDQVVLAPHFYGWVVPKQMGGQPSYGTDQNVANATVMSLAQDAQATLKSIDGHIMPVIFEEIGDSTTGAFNPSVGSVQDPNWRQSLQAVFNSGYGWAAWAWGAGPGDALTGGGAYQTMIQQAIRSTSAAGVSGCVNAAAPVITTVTAQAAAPTPSPAPDPISSPATSAQATALMAEQANAAADSQIKQAEAAAAQATRMIDPAQTQANLEQANAALAASLADIQAGIAVQ
jgi:hypothetical protein